jgi:hypothetical protein
MNKKFNENHQVSWKNRQIPDVFMGDYLTFSKQNKLRTMVMYNNQSFHFLITVGYLPELGAWCFG